MTAVIVAVVVAVIAAIVVATVVAVIAAIVAAVSSWPALLRDHGLSSLLAIVVTVIVTLPS